MKVENKKFNQLNKDQKQYLVDFIAKNYEAPEYLLPTIDELEKSDLTVFIASVPIDLFEAGNVGDEVFGLTFGGFVTDSLFRTRTTIVRKDMRGKGIAKALNDDLEDYCKAHNVNKISCNIYTNNLPSLFLKLKRGYIIEGLHKDHDEIGSHEYLVSKFL